MEVYEGATLKLITKLLYVFAMGSECQNFPKWLAQMVMNSKGNYASRIAQT